MRKNLTSKVARTTAFCVAVFGYCYAVIFAAVAGMAHPFLATENECKRACLEARDMIMHPAFSYWACAAMFSAIIAVLFLACGERE